MHIKSTVSLLSLLLYGVLSTPVLAQSGIVHFRGKIVAPVCTRVVLADGQSESQAPFMTDVSECGGVSGTAIATTHVVARKQPMATTTDAHTAPSGMDTYIPEMIWTTTYE